MPWAGDTFKLDLASPFEQYFQSLMAPPESADFSVGLPGDTDGLTDPLSGFVIPGFEDIVRVTQTLLASMVVAFDPLVAGSPVCPGDCTWGFPALVSMVQAIGELYPSNPYIDHWLNLANTDNPNPEMDGAQTGLVNWATPHQIFTDIQYLQGPQGLGYDFGNPPPSDPPLDGPYGVDTPISYEIAPELQKLIAFMQDNGIQQMVHHWADLAGYTPLDYGTDGTGDVASTAASDTSSLWSELMNPADWGSLF
jgi:hypothetical protein